MWVSDRDSRTVTGKITHMTSPIWSFIAKPDENKRFDWLISGPSKAVLDRQKGVLDREIEGLLKSTNKMDDKIF